MKQFLFVTTLLIVPLLAVGQSRKLEIYPDEFSVPTYSWWVSPSTLLSFDSSTGTITCADVSGRPVSNPIVWIRDIDHIKFRVDTSSCPELSDSSASGWKLASGRVAESLEILTPDDFSASQPVQVAVYDSAGSLCGGSDAWTGEPLRVSWLSPGIYFVKISNIASLSFLKL